MFGDINHAACMSDWIFDYDPGLDYFLDGALEVGLGRLQVNIIIASKGNSSVRGDIKGRFQVLMVHVNCWQANHMPNRKLIKCIRVIGSDRQSRAGLLTASG